MASSSSLDPKAEIFTFFFFLFLLCFFLLVLLFRKIEERSTSSSSASTPKLKSLPSSSSSSAPTPKLKWTYDVFLSFRGEDTRNNFVDHLFMNLKQKGINTFRDDEKLERGKEISDNLLKAIEESRFAIIIFSENYASSSWCLDELVKIIDCTIETGQIAYPVFYNVDPSNVRKQKGSFDDAFDEHKKKNLALGKMEKWKEALSRAGSISGWDTRGRPEAKIIQEIVEKILYMLSRVLLHVDDNLVGMEIHMKEINTLLDTRSNDVKFVGIHGLGGIGKTTIAKVIYNQIYNKFEGCSYLANVRERCEMEHSLVSVQKQLLYDILKVQDLQIGDDDSGSSVIQHRLNNQKVLVILDDVDDVNQLEKLAGNGKWFGPGSRIIITTRNRHLLNTYEAVQRYEVRGCDREKSLEIFSWKAFKQNYPREHYTELSNEVVHYAKGLPLALIVLGSHLCGRSEDEWECAIEELKIVPNEDVTKILEISYKGLKQTQKDVFLDIACFFNGEDKDKVMEKLHSFGFFPSINIQVLIDNSLITVSAKNELMMHDLVRDMGRHIVHQESPKDPGKRSRLWNTDDIRRVLEKNMATEAIEGIKLKTNRYSWSFKARAMMKMESWSFKAEAFMKMKNLRFLEWEYYPCEDLALDFPHDKLVHLSLKSSSLKLLWNGRKVLPLLKSIDLTGSGYLREFPDVSGLPNLERLSLGGCYSLVEIHPSLWVHELKFLDLSGPYLGNFPNKIEMESLVELDLSCSKDLREIPDVTGLPNLERLSLRKCRDLVKIHPSVWVHKGLKFLDLTHCYGMEEFPKVHGNMKRLSKLVLTQTRIKELPSSIENSTALKNLDLEDNKNLVCLPSSICKLKYLEELNLQGCRNLYKLPENIGDLESLLKLNASFTAIKEVPASIQFLVKLRYLSFNGCSGFKLRSFYGLPSSLTELRLSDCRGLKLPSFYGLSLLTFLDLSWFDLTDETFPSNIECLSSLKYLNLRGNKFVSLPTNITQLSLLTELHLSICRNLEKLPENIGDLESLVELYASETAIKEVPASIQFLVKLRKLSFAGCRGLKLPSFYGLSLLTELDLVDCDITDETFPSNIECLSSLNTLRLSGNSFVSLPTNITQLSLLTELHLSICRNLEKLPENIGDLESLVELYASETAIKEVPASIQFLVKLRKLSFAGCRGLKLPSFYGLSSLTELDLVDCDITDETFPSNIECLSSLNTLRLSGNSFVSLPTNITQLSLLTELHLMDCKRIEPIPELPSSTRIYLFPPI